MRVGEEYQAVIPDLVSESKLQINQQALLWLIILVLSWKQASVITL